MKKLIYAFSFCAALGMVSCGGDDDTSSDCNLVTFTQRADANLDLGTTYTNDMTKENCDAYKADLQDIVNEYGSCDNLVISAQVSAFETQLNSLDCQ